MRFRQGLLAGTAIGTFLVTSAGVAGAAEPLSYTLSGNANFQIYSIDQDDDIGQDNFMYFGVDEAEVQVDASGVADNGIKYGFKIELNANTSDQLTGGAFLADEARLQLSSGWGTIQLGDEDGVEETMNVGGETIMGATGGIDGDHDDAYRPAGAAPSYPTIMGDTGDFTKISYYSPRFSGFQGGISYTPAETNMDQFKLDGTYEGYVSLAGNYDFTYEQYGVTASVVLAMADAVNPGNQDIWSVQLGTVVRAGPVQLGVNIGDDGDLGSEFINAALAVEAGPVYLSTGILLGYTNTPDGEDSFSNLSFTGDYAVAPGLGIYAEVDLLSSEDVSPGGGTNDGILVIVGAGVNF